MDGDEVEWLVRDSGGSVKFRRTMVSRDIRSRSLIT